MYRVALTGSGIYCALPFFDYKLKLYYQDTQKNRRRIEDSSSLCTAEYFATPYLSSGILQTYISSNIPWGFSRSEEKIVYTRQYLKALDGGTISLDWSENVRSSPKGLVFIITGITGGCESDYILSLVSAAKDSGFVVAVFNGRGLDGNPLTSPNLTYLGNVEDLDLAIKAVTDKHSDLPILGIGTSMGGNLILKYAGKKGKDCQFRGIVALSTPFDILVCSQYLRKNRLSSYIADTYLANSVKNTILANYDQISIFKDSGIDIERALNSKRTYELDLNFTAKILGYENPDDYYRESSCVQDLWNIQVPVLALNSLDDPVVTKDCIPYEEFSKNENLILAVTRYGGHIGWFSGFFKPKRWHINPTFEFINSLLY